jgi:hypothetical protein
LASGSRGTPEPWSCLFGSIVARESGPMGLDELSFGGAREFVNMPRRALCERTLLTRLSISPGRAGSPSFKNSRPHPESN